MDVLAPCAAEGVITADVLPRLKAKMICGPANNQLASHAIGDELQRMGINSLLDAIGDAPAWVFLEAGHDDDRELPVNGGAEIIWVDRFDEDLLETLSASAFDASDHFGWVACNNRTTRAVARVFREEYGIPRRSIKAQAYWVA